MRVVVVGDERRARERLRRLLTTITGVEVVGEAATGVAALDAIARVKPDAVFLDVQMPGLTGFEVLSALPVALLLLVACTNIASLLVARAGPAPRAQCEAGRLAARAGDWHGCLLPRACLWRWQARHSGRSSRVGAAASSSDS